MTATNRPTMESLPNELFNEVLTLVSLQDVKSVRSCSRRLERAAAMQFEERGLKHIKVFRTLHTLRDLAEMTTQKYEHIAAAVNTIEFVLGPNSVVQPNGDKFSPTGLCDGSLSTMDDAERKTWIQQWPDQIKTDAATILPLLKKFPNLQNIVIKTSQYRSQTYDPRNNVTLNDVQHLVHTSCVGNCVLPKQPTNKSGYLHAMIDAYKQLLPRQARLKITFQTTSRRATFQADQEDMTWFQRIRHLPVDLELHLKWYPQDPRSEERIVLDQVAQCTNLQDLSLVMAQNNYRNVDEYMTPKFRNHQWAPHIRSLALTNESWPPIFRKLLQLPRLQSVHFDQLRTGRSGHDQSNPAGYFSICTFSKSKCMEASWDKYKFSVGLNCALDTYYTSFVNPFWFVNLRFANVKTGVDWTDDERAERRNAMPSSGTPTSQPLSMMDDLTEFPL
ncbi:hypothetical protein BDV95DRAFT_601722 [Massariosphaeria phaeospora]|uniref:F-box domain-containing protein n=1 Tax=Massariosphaeria phaeospora TaxID=100035 RepID=A0A7C8IIC1_9PLEO|nr:hypothetical protein BDV95DRAFT_601722 [Massariosphaeria phaeospora]